MVKQTYEYVLLPGFRANSNLLCIEALQQLFKLKYTKNSIKYYYCYQKKCHAGVLVEPNSKYCRHTAKGDLHNHESQSKLIKHLELLNKKKQLTPKRRLCSKDPDFQKHFVENGNSNKLSTMSVDDNTAEPFYEGFSREDVSFGKKPNAMKDVAVVSRELSSKDKQIFEYKLISGYKANSELLYIEEMQQIFIFKSILENQRKYYSCYQMSCSAGVKVDLGNTKYCRLAEKEHIHSHGSQIQTIEKFKYINSLNISNDQSNKIKVRKIAEENLFEYKIISGLRLNSALLYIEETQQIFKYKHTTNNSKYYYCYQKNCNAGAIVENNNSKFCRLSEKTNVHNHGSQINLVKKFNSHKFKETNGTANFKSMSANAFFKYKIIQGFTATSILLYIESEQQLFILQYNKNNFYYYCCYEKTCSVEVAVDGKNAQFCCLSSKINVHNHGLQTELIRKLKATNTLQNSNELESSTLKSLNVIDSNDNEMQNKYSTIHSVNNTQNCNVENFTLSIQNFKNYEPSKKPETVQWEELKKIIHDNNIRKEEQQTYNYKLVRGLRGNTQLLHIESIQQIFRFRYSRSNYSYYYCYDKQCYVGVVIDMDDSEYCRVFSKASHHNHGPQTALLDKIYSKSKNYTLRRQSITKYEPCIISEISQSSVECKDISKAENIMKLGYELFEYRFIAGLRESSQLLYIESIQQIFKFQYNRNSCKYYYCYVKECNVGVVVDMNETKYCRVCSKVSIHNHGPQTEFLEKLKMKRSITKQSQIYTVSNAS